MGEVFILLSKYCYSFLIGNSRIAVFRCTTCEPITTISLSTGSGGQKFTPSGIAVDNCGCIYVCDELNKSVLVLTDIATKLALL